MSLGPRVALVCPYDWCVPGGVQSHVRGLVRALRTRKLTVDVLAPASRTPAEEGVLGVGMPVPIPDNGSVARVALGPIATARVWRRVRSERYDLVHIHEPLVPAVSLAALFAARVPVVGTFHRFGPGPGWYRTFARVCRRGMPRIDARIAVSRAAARHVSLTFPGEFHIIPNGVDLAPHPFAGMRDGARLVFVGRAETRKGLSVLLRAFAALAPYCSLDLVGVSPAELSRFTRRLPTDVTDRIRARGVVSDEERRRLVGRADVMCAPALRGESFGIVIAEGMAAGVPVVASDIAGHADVVHPDAGRLVPAGDVHALARALGEILGDADLRRQMGAAGWAAAQRFAWSRVTDQILDVYTRAGSRMPHELRRRST